MPSSAFLYPWSCCPAWSYSLPPALYGVFTGDCPLLNALGTITFAYDSRVPQYLALLSSPYSWIAVRCTWTQDSYGEGWIWQMEMDPCILGGAVAINPVGVSSPCDPLLMVFQGLQTDPTLVIPCCSCGGSWIFTVTR